MSIRTVSTGTTWWGTPTPESPTSPTAYTAAVLRKRRSTPRETGRGGLVAQGEATEAIACRSAAVAGALPSYLTPATRESLGVVEGAAFCIVTDRGRVVRAQIDTITEGVDGVPEVILTLGGTAMVWSPQ